MIAPDDRSTTAERLRSDVEALCAVRDRRVGSPGHDAARAYLTERYAAIGLRPYGDTYELPYAGGGINFTNLVAVAPAKDAAANDAAPLLLAAHYDTVADTPGADDNAAAIAISLEVARRLTQQPAARPVVIAQFDAEEPPYFHTRVMGSTHFHARQARTPIHAAVVLDLVGHAVPVPGIEEAVFMTGMESDPALEGTVTELDPIDGIRLVTTLTRDVATRTLDGPWESFDTTATDIATMRAALAPLLDGFGIQLASRRDIERVVALLLRREML